ncbi:transposase [Streptomyces sp. NPDC054932]
MTDAQWARIEPLLPDRAPRRGGRWRDHRQVIDAIASKYRSGTPWMDLPAHFGSWKGAHNRLRKWAADGTWDINRLKQWRGLASRYDKNATIYLAGLHLVAFFIWSAR